MSVLVIHNQHLSCYSSHNSPESISRNSIPGISISQPLKTSRLASLELFFLRDAVTLSHTHTRAIHCYCIHKEPLCSSTIACLVLFQYTLLFVVWDLCLPFLCNWCFLGSVVMCVCVFSTVFVQRLYAVFLLDTQLLKYPEN